MSEPLRTTNVLVFSKEHVRECVLQIRLCKKTAFCTAPKKKKLHVKSLQRCQRIRVTEFMQIWLRLMGRVGKLMGNSKPEWRDNNCPRELKPSLLCLGLSTLKTKMSNQAQIKHKHNATVHYCSHVANSCSQLALKTLGQTFVFSQHRSLRLRCGLEPNKDKSHKSRTARTRENYLKALTKSKNMAVRFGKQAKHLTTGFKRGAAGKNTLLHKKMQETLQKPN